MPPTPAEPKIYHIVHEDRLPSIIADGFLWSDAHLRQGVAGGTTIGFDHIKRRRLTAPLKNHPGLHVGECVPFYFCPHSVMLFLIHRRNPELGYQGGQEPIVHLEADLRQAVAYADRNEQRWAFTTSNAGSRWFEDYSNLSQLDQIEWAAVEAGQWSAVKESKQAEFLVERSFPWELVLHIGVQSEETQDKVRAHLEAAGHRPSVTLTPSWYY